MPCVDGKQTQHYCSNNTLDAKSTVVRYLSVRFDFANDNIKQVRFDTLFERKQ